MVRRWLRTTWKASPAWMYSRIRSTAASKSARDVPLRKGGSSAGAERERGAGGAASRRVETTASARRAASS